MTTLTEHRFTRDARRDVIHTLYMGFHEDGIPIRKNALQGLFAWRWHDIVAFSREVGRTPSEIIQRIDSALSAHEHRPIRYTLPKLGGETSGDRLREARRMQKKTQVEFEHLSGIPSENLSRYERDARSLRQASLRTIYAIACGLECELLDVYRRILLCD